MSHRCTAWLHRLTPLLHAVASCGQRTELAEIRVSYLQGRIQQPFVGHRWAALKCNIAVERVRTGGSAVEGDLNLADDAWVCAKSSVPATHPLRIVLRARLGSLGWRQGDATALQKPKS